MHRFYSENISGSTVTIDGTDVGHIRNVLRLRPGDRILVGDGAGREYTCCIESMDEDSVTAAIEDVNDVYSELPARITLYQGVPKGDKLELIIQKAVELGVYKVVPVMMERTVVKLDAVRDAAKIEKRVRRYRMIAESAAKQSGRGIVPEVESFVDMDKAVAMASEGTAILVPYESARGIDYTREVMADMVGRESISVFIGPEGGFSDGEIDRLSAAGGRIITLGRRILRTETAGLTTLSILMYELEGR